MKNAVVNFILRKFGNQCPKNTVLTSLYNNQNMRVAMATNVALLILNFADEHFNSARYTQAAMGMLSHIARSFG